MSSLSSLFTTFVVTISFLQATVLTLERNGYEHTGLIQRQTCSSEYDFSISEIDIVQLRSAVHDTVYVSACVATRDEFYCHTGYYGQHGKATFDPAIRFRNISVADDDVAILAYLIINQGISNNVLNVETVLGNATLLLAQRANMALFEYGQQDVAEIIALHIGTSLAAIVAFVTNVAGSGVENLLTTRCDGWLAAGVHGFRGNDNCGSTLQGTDDSSGSGDPELLGFIPICNTHTSQYNISWLVTSSDESGNSTLPGSYLAPATPATPTTPATPAVSQNGLSQSTKIALGVGISFGVPTVVACWFVAAKWRSRRRRRAESASYPSGAPNLVRKSLVPFLIRIVEPASRGRIRRFA
jgi:hypothetical protein